MEHTVCGSIIQHNVNAKTRSNSGGRCISVTRTQLTFVNTILWWKSNGNTGARRGVFLCWPSMHTLRCTSLFLDRITPGHVTWMEKGKIKRKRLRQFQGGQVQCSSAQSFSFNLTTYSGFFGSCASHHSVTPNRWHRNTALDFGTPIRS